MNLQNSTNESNYPLLEAKKRSGPRLKSRKIRESNHVLGAHEYYPESHYRQRFFDFKGEVIGLVDQDSTGLTPKLEQIIHNFEFTQIELAVSRDRGYAQGRGVGQPEEDRCALACAFLAKTVLGLLTTRALIDRLQADSKLRRLCGFDQRFALPSEAIFSLAFGEFATSELMQRVHTRMIKDTLGEQLIGRISAEASKSLSYLT